MNELNVIEVLRAQIHQYQLEQANQIEMLRSADQKLEGLLISLDMVQQNFHMKAVSNDVAVQTVTCGNSMLLEIARKLAEGNQQLQKLISDNSDRQSTREVVDNQEIQNGTISQAKSECFMINSVVRQPLEQQVVSQKYDIKQDTPSSDGSPIISSCNPSSGFGKCDSRQNVSADCLILRDQIGSISTLPSEGSGKDIESQINQIYNQAMKNLDDQHPDYQLREIERLMQLSHINNNSYNKSYSLFARCLARMQSDEAELDNRPKYFDRLQ